MTIVGSTANVLAGVVTCKITLISICSGGNVEISLMCSGKGVWSNTTIDWGPWCKCSWFAENQSIAKDFAMLYRVSIVC